MTCLGGCDSGRRTCETGCPAQGSFQACMDCGAACGLNAAACAKGCG